MTGLVGVGLKRRHSCAVRRAEGKEAGVCGHGGTRTLLLRSPVWEEEDKYESWALLSEPPIWGDRGTGDT